ncbi:snake venom 5'-nucleotidase [Patella vulgata]|uniref:snake venom 5'-nucleotidase n=1 Tax=Patella vulgata TaxID=6465 RepID=UPI0024A8782D|nr:snake venom 5'-nucleotidase [Patella vulgata]
MYYLVWFPVLLGYVSCNYELTVLHTNDIHDRFEQTDKYSGVCSIKLRDEGKCFGGIARRQTKIKELRAKYANTVLLDAGDQFQGTLWYYNYGGTIVAKFLNLLGYDAMSFGNHEFDDGVKGALSLVNNTDIPILACNIDSSLEPELQGQFKNRTTIVINGRRIGVVGYITTETKQISRPGRLMFIDEISAVREQVNQLINEGVDIIIALGHAGISTDKRIAEEIDGVDVVIGGHTNTFLYTGQAPSNDEPEGEYPTVITQTSGRKVLVVQDYAFGKYLGFLQVTFDDNGEVTSWTGNPILLDNSTIQDADILAEMVVYKAGVEASSSEVVGRSQVYLESDPKVCRVQECNLGNLIADSMVHQNLKHSDSLEWSDVSIAIMNSGGIRSPVSKGDITIEAILSVLPFRNTIDIIEIKGKYIRQSLEYTAVRRSFVDYYGGFFQFSGLKVVFNMNNTENNRVVSVQVKCTKCVIPRFVDLEMEEIYKVVLPSYIVLGGDGHTHIKNNVIRRHIIGDLDTDVLIEYIRSVSPVAVGLEDRITFVENNQSSCLSPSSLSSITTPLTCTFLLILILCLTSVTLYMQY